MKLNLKKYYIAFIVLFVALTAIILWHSLAAGKKQVADTSQVANMSAVMPQETDYRTDSAALYGDMVLYDKKATVTVSDTNQINIDIKKVVKNANVSMKAAKIDEAYLKINSYVKANGGYEFSRNESVKDKYKKINVVFKIPPEKLTVFIEFLKETGNVYDSTISGEDITDRYYDTATRLDNLLKGREQLLIIQKKAVTITDLLKVQNELNNITGEIESLQGKIKMWDKMVAESTVYVSIDEEANPLKPSKEINWKFSSLSDVWNTMKNYFILVTNTVVSALTWVIIIAVSILPLAVIACGIIILIRYISKRKMKK